MCVTPTYPKKIKGSAGSTNFPEVEEETPKAVLEKGLRGPHKPKSNEVDLNEDDPMPIGNQTTQKGADQSADPSKKTRSKTSPIYNEVEEAKRQQAAISGSYQRHQSRDQRSGRLVEFVPRAAIPQQSGSSSTTPLDFGNAKSGRQICIGSVTEIEKGLKETSIH